MTYSKPHYLVTIGGTMAGNELWQTGARFCGTGTPSASEFVAGLAVISASDIYDDAAAVISAGPSWAFPNTTKIAWAKVAAVGTDGRYLSDAIVFNDATPTAGVGTTGRLPNQVALGISLWSGQTLGKGNYGRMYFPSVMASVETDGRWDAGMGTALGANVEAMLNAWEGELQTAAGVSDLQLSIMAQGATPQNKAVAWIRVGRVPDTQRRRRNALVESYVDTAWTTP